MTFLFRRIRVHGVKLQYSIFHVINDKTEDTYRWADGVGQLSFVDLDKQRMTGV